MNYIYEFAAVAAVTGFLGFFSDKLKGGMGKAVNYIACLILMLSIITPTVSIINRGGLSGNFPEIEITQEPSDEGEYLQKLKSLTEENLTLMEYKGINKQFGYGKEDIELEFIGKVEDGIYKLEEVRLTVKTVKALSRRDEIRGYVSGKYLCDVIVIEKIV